MTTATLFPETFTEPTVSTESSRPTGRADKIRLVSVKVKESEELGVQYECLFQRSKDGRTWKPEAKRIDEMKVSLVSARLEDLKSVIRRGYRVPEDAWEDCDFDVTMLSLKYADPNKTKKKKKKGDKSESEAKIGPGTMLEATVKSLLVTHASKEKNFTQSVTMDYSPNGDGANGYLNADETVAIESISRILQDAIIEELSLVPKFESVQIELELR